MEGFLFGKLFRTTGESEFPLVESALQTSDELAAEHAAQYFHRQEEGVARVDPAWVIE